MGTTHASWTIDGTDGTVSKTIGAGLSLRHDGSLEFAADLGWDASLDNVASFHGHKVARRISGQGIGGPAVAATVTVLEDLTVNPDLFRTDGESSPPLRTIILSEKDARGALLPVAASDWPPVKDGQLEGVTIAEVLIDSHGNVTEVGTTLSDNPGLIDAAAHHIGELHFRPRVVDGQPALVVTTITMPFKTVRPAGMETFDSARNYFEHGRKIGFPAAGARDPYLLTCEFQIRSSSGNVETGTYTDTFADDMHWRREVILRGSRFIRTRSGDKTYLQSEGVDAGILRLVMMFIEPIPAIESFVESDWRIQREQVNGLSTVRVASGYENSDGTPDPVMFRGYWFDDSGQLVKAYVSGLDIRRTDFKEFNGVQVAQRIDVLKDGHLVVHITTTGMQPPQSADPKLFVLKRHEWERRFTAEVR
jgi:hypothetical protein